MKLNIVFVNYIQLVGFLVVIAGVNFDKRLSDAVLLCIILKD